MQDGLILQLFNMKYILTLLFLVSFVAYGQEPAYTPMRLSYQFRGIKVDSLFLIPSFIDTNAANNSTMKNVAGSMIRTGNDFWMRNAATTAWLQNVNVGSGSSVNVQFVDSVWRVAGKDSIFWRKGGLTYKIKDSSGSAYAGDSPDRINGSATDKVISSFSNRDWDINSINLFTLQGDVCQETYNDYSLVSGQVYIQGAGNKGLNIYLDTNLIRISRGNKSMLKIDTLGSFQAGDLTTDELTMRIVPQTETIDFQSKNALKWKEPVSQIESQVKTGYGVNGIDLSLGQYDILVPGIYVIEKAVGSDIVLPDAANWKGQSFQIVNTDANDANLSAVAGTINQVQNSSVGTTNKVDVKTTVLIYSDGTDWYVLKF